MLSLLFSAYFIAQVAEKSRIIPQKFEDAPSPRGELPRYGRKQ